MQLNPPITLCLQVAPNTMGIDHVRISLPDKVVELLAEHDELLRSRNLINLRFEAPTLQWMREGIAVKHGYPWSSCQGQIEMFETGLVVSHSFIIKASAHGVFDKTIDISAMWLYGGAADENFAQDYLAGLADENNEIWERYPGKSLLEEVSHDAELARVCSLAKIKNQMPYPKDNRRAWPDPFARWSGQHHSDASACTRLPRDFEPTLRRPAANTVLAQLLKTANERQTNANERLSQYLFAVALLICPDDVVITAVPMSNVPTWLDVALPGGNDRLAPNERLKPEHLLAEKWAVTLQYQTMCCKLHKNAVGRTYSLDGLHYPNVALLYEDHIRKDDAQKLLNDFLTVHSGDKALVTVLAVCIDALLRRPDSLERWTLDLRRPGLYDPLSFMGDLFRLLDTMHIAAGQQFDSEDTSACARYPLGN